MIKESNVLSLAFPLHRKVSWTKRMVPHISGHAQTMAFTNVEYLFTPYKNIVYIEKVL
jgi:hypothetical protein